MTMACGLPLSLSSNKLRPNPSGYSYNILQHPKNQALRDKFAAKEISDRDFYRQILLLIYRLLFLVGAVAAQW